jgi:hypothetical protein
VRQANDLLLLRETPEEHFRPVLWSSPDMTTTQPMLSRSQFVHQALLNLIGADNTQDLSGARPELCVVARLLGEEDSTDAAEETLELLLWGPPVDGVVDDQEQLEEQLRHYRGWLHLERASLLNDILRSQGLREVALSIFEQSQLRFAVKATAESLRRISRRLSAALATISNTNL